MPPAFFVVMKHRIYCGALLLIAGLVSIASLHAQTPGAPPTRLTYTAWLTGDSADVQPTPLGGVVLGGGSTDVREAMQWLLQRAAGGDVVILRASGRDGYNDYLYRELGVPVNSVETSTADIEQATLVLTRVAGQGTALLVQPF